MVDVKTLLNIIADAGYTNVEIAKTVGVTKSRISQLKRNSTRPGRALYKALADLACSVAKEELERKALYEAAGFSLEAKHD